MNLARLMACLAAGALAITVGGAPAQACSIEFGNSYYRITPEKDDGLSNAERVKCAKGALIYYAEPTGWAPMLNANGGKVVALDINGIQAGEWDFMVLVTEANELIMRFGSPADGDLYVNDQSHSTFLAYGPDGKPIKAMGIGEVKMQGGQIMVGVRSRPQLYCEILSDAQWNFDWQNWSCRGPLTSD